MPKRADAAATSAGARKLDWNGGQSVMGNTHGDEHRRCGIALCNIRASSAKAPLRARIALASWLPRAVNPLATVKPNAELTTSDRRNRSRNRPAPILLNGQAKGFRVQKVVRLERHRQPDFRHQPSSVVRRHARARSRGQVLRGSQRHADRTSQYQSDRQYPLGIAGVIERVHFHAAVLAA